MFPLLCKTKYCNCSKALLLNKKCYSVPKNIGNNISMYAILLFCLLLCKFIFVWIIKKGKKVPKKVFAKTQTVYKKWSSLGS